MRLVYIGTGIEVKVKDRIPFTDSEGRKREVEVVYFREPHKPSSIGKVSVRYIDEKAHSLSHLNSMEYYVSVIGAEWIEREDRLDA